MNDLLKFASHALKPFGYHIRKYKAPNILRISALERRHPSLKSLRRASGRDAIASDARFDRLIIYVRTCLRANRNIDTKPRVTSTDMREVTLRCLRSLVKAVNHAAEKQIEMIILDDRSDANALEEIKTVLDDLTVPFTIRQTENAGQGHSLHQQFSEGKNQNALVYFVEDDYLHEPDAIAVMWDFYKDMVARLGTHCVIYPQEHAVLYDDHYPSYVLAGKDRHWRTIRHATHTFWTHGHVVRDHWKYFENTKFVGIKKHRKKGSEARTTNKLFEIVPGFSPLRPAAVHLQFENTLPPLYDWKNLWDANED